MNKYEVMYILNCAADEATLESQVEKFNKIIVDNGGKVEEIDKWGRRRLAYPIDFKNEGYYVLLQIEAQPELPLELERNFRISEEIMRYIVVKKEA